MADESKPIKFVAPNFISFDWNMEVLKSVFRRRGVRKPTLFLQISTGGIMAITFACQARDPSSILGRCIPRSYRIKAIALHR